MGTALGIAIVSVAFGALLGFSRRATALTAIQTFAVVAALGVVLVHLLPEALAGAGLVVLVVFGVSLVGGHALDRWSHHAGRGHLGLEVGFVGLCVHKLADGIALGHYASPIWPGLGPISPSFDVLFAVAAHSVPVTAMVVLAFLPRGAKHALGRAAVLAICAVVGVLLVSVIPNDAMAAANPWIAAVTGGLLVHIVFHGWTHPTPTGRAGRIMDMAAAASGVVLVLFGQGQPGGAADVRAATGAALWELSLETAPILLIGLTLAALLQTFGRRIPQRWLRGGRPFGQAAKGALVGLPLPVCACGILPVAHSLQRRKAAPALVVAFLLATPELGIETFALSVQFLGWSFAWARLGAAVAVAIMAALIVAAVVRKPAAEPSPTEAVVDVHPEASRVRFFLSQLDEILKHTLPWTAVGLLAAAYFQAVLPADAFIGWGIYADFFVVTLVAVPSYVCATSATPMAAVLISKGLSPGAVLVGLLLGPATNLATAGWLKATYGMRATIAGLGGLIVTAWIMGGLTNLFDVPVTAHLHSHAHQHGWGAMASVGVLCVLATTGIWLSGLRGWLAALRGHVHDEDDDHEHGHGHGHAHGHGHGHA